MVKNRSLLEFTYKDKKKEERNKQEMSTFPHSSEKQNGLAKDRENQISKSPINATNKSLSTELEMGPVEKPYKEDVYINNKFYETSELRIEIPQNIDIENPRIKKIEVNANIIDKIDNAYLLQVDYDGDLKKAVLIFYDTQNNELVYWYDKTGHKPYFLTDIPPDKISKISDIVRHSSFESVEVIEKFDPLSNIKRNLTKIVTKDPIAVRGLRTKVPIAWEADIRYHINYIYDRQLIPGLPYTIYGDKILEIHDIDVEKVKENIVKTLGINSMSSEITIHFAKLFETKWFTPKRIAIDIEVYTPFEGRIPSPEFAEYPIMSISLASNDNTRKVLVLFRENLKILKEIMCDADIEIYDSEYGMLIDFLSIISQYPIIITFNGDNFDLRYLYVRMIKLGLPKELVGIKVKKVLKGG